mmetsp:Transcript_39408/g.76580  ORF Transcript_39408/g.76580 Transcript_39408/m.76580 type:complete len:372 (+) Transcript_39408:113-1228(+)
MATIEKKASAQGKGDAKSGVTEAGGFTGFLKGLKIEQYRKAIGEALIEKGALDILIGMEEEELKAVLTSAGVKPGHRAKVVRALPGVKEERRKAKLLAMPPKCSSTFLEAEQHHVVLPQFPASPALRSVAAWVRINPSMEDYRSFNNGCGAYIFSSSFYARDKNYGMSVFKNNNVSGIYVAEWGGPNVRLSVNICDGEWHHVAQSNKDLYVDGKRVGAISNHLHEARDSLRVAFGPKGAVGYRSTRNGDIAIRDFQLFTRELDANEIKDACAHGRGRSMKSPLVHLPLNADVKDYSGNGYDGRALDRNNQEYLPAFADEDDHKRDLRRKVPNQPKQARLRKPRPRMRRAESDSESSSDSSTDETSESSVSD